MRNTPDKKSVFELCFVVWGWVDYVSHRDANAHGRTLFANRILLMTDDRIESLRITPVLNKMFVVGACKTYKANFANLINTFITAGPTLQIKKLKH